jgi:phosphate transport system permease protein
VQVAMGDLPHASIGFQCIFAAGLVLFAMPLWFSILGHIVRNKYREQY